VKHPTIADIVAKLGPPTPEAKPATKTDERKSLYAERARARRRAKAIKEGRQPGLTGRPITKHGRRAVYAREWKRKTYVGKRGNGGKTQEDDRGTA
jgi:hypothetical protein